MGPGQGKQYYFAHHFYSPLLAPVHSLILTVASRLLHLYSPDGKTSRLMMKSLFTVKDTQRGSQNYMEKRRREEGDRGHQEEERGNQKGREQSSQ